MERPLIQLHLKAVVRGSALPIDTAADLDKRVVQRSLLLRGGEAVAPWSRPVVADAGDRRDEAAARLDQSTGWFAIEREAR